MLPRGTNYCPDCGGQLTYIRDAPESHGTWRQCGDCHQHYLVED